MSIPRRDISKGDGSENNVFCNFFFIFRKLNKICLFGVSYRIMSDVYRGYCNLVFVNNSVCEIRNYQSLARFAAPFLGDGWRMSKTMILTSGEANALSIIAAMA